jgi:hypothetical protein
VNDHDFTQEENCLGPIQVQGWPTSGTTQQVCATAPADPMTLPSDCLSFSLFYVPGTETPVPDLPADTGSPGEAGIIDVINPVDVRAPPSTRRLHTDSDTGLARARR